DEDKDLELQPVPTAHLVNNAIDTFSWRDMRVVVKDRETGQPIDILAEASGLVRAGEMLAIMGPSGSGKTTLLNTLSRRTAAAGATTTGQVMANDSEATPALVRTLTSYVEQEDALIGSITVRETVIFAARLAFPSNVTRKDALARVDELISSFGLQSQAHTIVGTPLRKGLSGGQKKRLGICSRLVTNPKVLFLDEPTSGLDSALSSEVMRYIKEVGMRNRLVVVASIHQPSTTTYQLFDKLALMSRGRTCYFGSVRDAPSYFGGAGHPLPPAINPAEFLLDLINTDLDRDGSVVARTDDLVGRWSQSAERRALSASISEATTTTTTTTSALALPGERTDLSRTSLPGPSAWMVPVTLMHRSLLKAYRDVFVYGIRVAMYLGLAVLMGTVFLRFGSDQRYVQPLTNSIFFGGAFMSFMSVAYVPALLEDLHTFKRERADGLAGPLSFVASSFAVGLPFLFAISVLFSVVTYWLTGFRADGAAFMTYLLWLFLDLVAAESLVLLVSSLAPTFVVALAVTAFANGLWMVVDGFLVPMTILNPFWKYVFHYIDYQAYVFQGMMVNEFDHRTFDCAAVPGQPDSYRCMYSSDLNSQGQFRGTDVLRSLGIDTGLQGTWLGIMVGIIAGYRLLGYLALRFIR
ncbi:ABC-type branched-chain amino acid transport system, ATPase component, partial [Geosmithia morbida]